MEYILNFKIPCRHYRDVWEKNYPEVGKILGECYFILVDTYGLPKSCIIDFHDRIKELIKQGHIIKLRAPRGFDK